VRGGKKSPFLLGGIKKKNRPGNITVAFHFFPPKKPFSIHQTAKRTPTAPRHSNGINFTTSKHRFGRRVIVNNLRPDVTSQDLQEIFKMIGPVKQAFVSFDEQGRSRGAGEVQFKNDQNADIAVSRLHGMNVDGRPMQLHVVGDTSGLSPAAQAILEAKVPQPSAQPTRRAPNNPPKLQQKPQRPKSKPLMQKQRKPAVSQPKKKAPQQQQAKSKKKQAGHPLQRVETASTTKTNKSSKKKTANKRSTAPGRAQKPAQPKPTLADLDRELDTIKAGF
jgi:RNA recognition motif-containing protein